VVAAAKKLGLNLELVEGVDHHAAFERYKGADLVVDQLNAGWYGMFAIETMALGKPVVAFLHEEATKRTEEAFGLEVPIVHATKDTLADVLEDLVSRPDELRRIGAASRAYVEQVHDLSAVADRLLDLYAGLE
jgi:glycosyltransferase involved in cell wall biosynthesis